MDKDEFRTTLSLIGTVGFLSALLPGIDKLWESDPSDADIQRNVTSATTLFSAVAAILIINAYAVGYKRAAALGSIVLVTAVFYYHYAFKAEAVKEFRNIRVIEDDA